MADKKKAPESLAEPAARQLMKLFAGYGSAHGTHGMPEQESGSLKWGIKKTARTLREPVTLELWVAHLEGRRPLGVIPIREDSRCQWGSIDVDQYDGDLLPTVEEVERRKLPLVPCRSKSGGLHLFLFLEEPVEAGAVLSTLRDLAASLGLAGCEIFPKQTQVLTERNDLGNWMVMPYYGDTFGDRLQQQVGLRKTGAEMTVEDFVRLAERSRVSPEDFAKLGSPARRSRGPGKRGRVEGGGSEDGGLPFADGPPCLQHLSAMKLSEGRNSTLFMMGIYLKRKSPDGWREELDDYNRRFFNPPMSADEVQATITSLARKEYQYTCKTEPMASHCDAAVCRTRRWGVGEEGNYPVISGLSKLDTQPPVWFVDVEDQRLEVSTEELQNYGKFNLVCMARLNRCYRVMKQDTWQQVVSAAMQNLVLLDAPPDVGEDEQFREMLEEFLTNRQRGQSAEELVTGRPWQDPDDARHYFRLGDLMQFLQRQGQRDVKRTWATRRLEALGGSHKFFNVKGHGVNTWWVPGDAVHVAPDVEPRRTGETTL